MEEKGRHGDAVQHLAAAVRYQPNYVEAHLALADTLRRIGRVKESLSHYEEAMQINPRSSPARLGYALALAGLGRSAAARDWLIESSGLYPDRQEYRIALARLLAASPDDRVRDGRRALDIANELASQQKSTDVGETLAMALAEVGDFDRAADVQRGILAATQKGGLAASARRMADNLRLYEHRRPCRTPWAADHPVVLTELPAGAAAAAIAR